MAGFSCGIVGLPNVGKSTLFNAITGLQAAASNYPFCTIDPNVGIVNVPDPRLAVLAQFSESKQTIYATTTFVDIAGLVKGAASGEGLGNQFLANIRETDAIAHVVRCFGDSDVVHVEGGIDPIRDIEVINLELILADMQMLDNVMKRLEKQARGNKEIAEKLTILQKAAKHLNENKPIRTLGLTPEERAAIAEWPLLTAKKVIYVPNVSESDLPAMDNAHVRAVRDFAAKEGSEIVPICAKLEEELAQLEKADAHELLESMGLKESGLERLIKASFHALGLITYLTTGEKETRAWTIQQGSTAPVAAGKIHTDLQKGFIRAEVVAYTEFVAHEGWVGAKKAGKVRAEGKEYIMHDGDIVVFLHN